MILEFSAFDSIKAARISQDIAHSICVRNFNAETSQNRQSKHPPCAPAMCGVFTTKTFWNMVPKVFVHPYINDKKNRKPLEFFPLHAEEEISKYMSRNKLDEIPLRFSGIAGHTKIVVPEEHEAEVFVICEYDSVGMYYLKQDRHKYFPFNLEMERRGTVGTMFGELFVHMLQLNYKQDKPWGSEEIGEA